MTRSSPGTASYARRDVRSVVMLAPIADIQVREIGPSTFD